MKSLLIPVVLLIALFSCKKESVAPVYTDNAYLDQWALTSKVVQVTTCKAGVIVFPNVGSVGYNPAMKITYSVSPNKLISFSPIDSFYCN